jgi:hypothetical protein
MKILQFVIAALIGSAPVLAQAASAEPLEFKPGTAKTKATLSRVPELRELVADPFSVAFVDLDGDGKNEMVIASTSSAFCGSGGCLTMVMQQRGPRLVTLLEQNLFPGLGVTKEKFAGYRALAALDEKGQIAVANRPGAPMHGKLMIYPMKAPRR